MGLKLGLRLFYENRYYEAKFIPFAMKIHPGMFFWAGNPKIQVRRTENKGKDYFSSHVRVAARLFWYPKTGNL